ncbi:hypothetical protein FHY02_004042 [Sphingomonas sp. BK069]|nr:hypothetical protein [Sphingomonas sp. BK069]
MSATKQRMRRLSRAFFANSLVQIPVFAALVAVASVAAMKAYGGLRSAGHSVAPCSESATAAAVGLSRSADVALQPARILLPIAAHLRSIGILGAVHVRH